MIRLSAFIDKLIASRAWIDLVIFASGWALGWRSDWQTGDLIWSLWLSSLVLGYAMICTGAFAPCILQWRERQIGAAVWAALNGIATLAFFTLHFGVFHAAQAGILDHLFPLPASAGFSQQAIIASSAIFLLGVLRAYWPFLLLSLLSERHNFALPPMPPEPPHMSVKAQDIEVRKARQNYGSMLLFSPYLNVIRMHFLIFALAGLDYLHLNGAVSYSLVYAAYFLPWRVLKS